MEGIEKRVDALGRVVIPIEFRKEVGIKLNSKVLVSLDGNAVTISSTSESCALCGKQIKENCNFRLCDSCISKIKEE